LSDCARRLLSQPGVDSALDYRVEHLFPRVADCLERGAATRKPADAAFAGIARSVLIGISRNE
jgi:hypothetical protein